MPTEAEKKKAETDSMWAAAFFGVLIIIVIALFVVFGGDDTSGDSSAQERTAKSVCHEAVEAQLKSPSSADFTDRSVDHDGDDITVIGYVDSDNSFGASLRSSFTCNATVDGDTVRVENAYVDEGS